MPAPRRGRRSPLVAIGAAVSLAGLSFYLYQRYIDSAPSADPRNDSSQSSGETSQSGRKKFKPSLSLSLPTSFLRTPENVVLLKGLLSMLSQQYLVTLIAPPSSPSQTPRSPHNADLDASGGGVHSVAGLSHTLSHIEGFDSRRVLEYSKEEGRLALARALACDAHCETMLENIKCRAEEEVDSLDGDLTPRATSPAPLSSKQRRAEEDKVALLERYHADMAQIRKSSSLLIFLVLPIPSPSLTLLSNREDPGDAPPLTISHIDVETVIQPFLLPGQQELSSRVPGVKVVDERRRAGSAGAGIEEAWKQAAKRVGLLSKGWQ